jgi:hypothetical protein
LVAGKGGVLYVVNRDHLGHWQPDNDSHAVQSLGLSGGVFGSMAYWNHYVYVSSEGDKLRQFAVTGGKLSFKAESAISGASATPTISASGSNNGIVWLLRSKTWNGDDPAALHAYDAANVAVELYNSDQNAGRDRPGPTLRFNNPMDVNGHVYVGSKHEVDVYGLLPDR